MNADWMKKSIGVGHDARRRERDHLVQARRRFEWKPRHDALVDIRVRAGISFQQVLVMTDHVDGARRDREGDGKIKRHGHRRAYVDVSLERLESLDLD